MANINDWKSCTDYDDDLSKIEHYKKHPEMMPYIGKHYNEARILLVGESHYVNNIQYDIDYWYNSGVSNELKAYENWFTTRHVVGNFMKRIRSRAHGMFGNPAKEIIRASQKNISDSEAFAVCAFMNYFQRPESSKGGSISTNEKSNNNDNKFAYETFQQVYEIIKPKIIIFLSKKAYWSYIKNADMVGNVIPNIDCVVHPTCRHWNSENGKIAFSKLLDKVDLSKVNFSEIKLPNYNDLKKAMPTRILSLETTYKSKKFVEDKINIKIHNKNGTVYKVIWYFKSNDRRYEIGYDTKYNTALIWNYDEKKYVAEKHPDVAEVYCQIKQFIESL